MEESAAINLSGNPSDNGPVVYRFHFEGIVKEMFLLVLVNMMLTALTLGVYQFWGKTRTRKYIWSHLRFNNDRFEYTGTGKELFRSAAKLMVIGVIIYFLIQYTIGMISMQLAGIIPSLLFFVLIPFAQYSGRNYRLSRTRWRGIRMGMTRERLAYVKLYLTWTILSALSLGLLAPQRWHTTNKFLIDNTRIGTHSFTYAGTSNDIFGRFIFNIFLTVITLGIYYPWHAAWRERYKWKHTRFMGARFKYVVSGADMFLLYLHNIFVAIITLGLAYPYIIHYNISFFSERLAVLGAINFQELEQAAHEGSADGEEMADFLDVDFGF